MNRREFMTRPVPTAVQGIFLSTDKSKAFLQSLIHARERLAFEALEHPLAGS
jgi:hypothetical protein